MVALVAANATGVVPDNRDPRSTSLANAQATQVPINPPGRAVPALPTGEILQFEANLPEVLFGFEIRERGDNFLQWKPAVDNGLDAIRRYRPNHVLLICSASNRECADANLTRQECPGRHFARKTSQDADQGDMSACPARQN